MTGRRRVQVVGVLALGVSFALLAASANAGTVSKYQPRRDARTFAHGAGGWTSTVDYGQGLCDPQVNCHTVSNSWHGQGGVRGSGYIDTRLNGSLGAAGVSSGTWRSPGFRYRGAKGKRPNHLDLLITRRFDIAGLLDVEGNSAHYTVEIVNPATGVAVAPIDGRRMHETPGWTRQRVRLGSGALQVGKRYGIKVTTAFKAGAQVFPDATADYDNIVLRASRSTRGGHGHHRPPHPGGGSGHHPGGSGHTAVLRHNRLQIRARCSKKERPGRCRIKVVALAHKGERRVTRAGHARVRAGHHKRIRMRVRRRSRHWLKKHHHVVVRERVRVHHHTHHITRRYRIVRQ